MNDKTDTTKVERRLQLLRDKNLSFFLNIIGLLSFVAFIYSSSQDYRKITIVQFKNVILSCIVIGFIIGTLKLKYAQRVKQKKFNIFEHYIMTTIIYGYLFWGLFVFTNINFSKSNLFIIKSSILARVETFKGNKYVTVNINGVEKDIPFPNNEMREINLSNYVVLTLNKGFWGIPYVVDKKLAIDYNFKEP